MYIKLYFFPDTENYNSRFYAVTTDKTSRFALPLKPASLTDSGVPKDHHLRP
jgi:hypothetical protein